MCIQSQIRISTAIDSQQSMPAGLQIACIETAERARHGPGSSVTGNTALAAFLLAGWADERPGTFAAVFLRGHTHTHSSGRISLR